MKEEDIKELLYILDSIATSLEKISNKYDRNEIVDEKI